MEALGWVSLAPGEDGYAFQFTFKSATAFCESQAKDYGYPTKINP